MWHDIKEKIIDVWYRFVDIASENQKKTLTIVIAILIIVSVGAFSLPMIQTNIRESEIEAVVTGDIQSERLKTVNYKTAKKELSEKKAVSVMFSQPVGETYQEIITVAQNLTNTALNRSFYYYPLVYDQETLASEYQLNPEEVTVIFFEDGVEKNRFVADQLEDISADFVDTLNRLPLGGNPIETSADKEEEKTTESTKMKDSTTSESSTTESSSTTEASE